jgi:hypothetical protein
MIPRQERLYNEFREKRKLGTQELRKWFELNPDFDTNINPGSRYSYLYMALYDGDVNLAKLLMDFGATFKNMSLMDCDCCMPTLTQTVCRMGYTECVRLMIENGHCFFPQGSYLMDGFLGAISTIRYEIVGMLMQQIQQSTGINYERVFQYSETAKMTRLIWKMTPRRFRTFHLDDFYWSSLKRDKPQTTYEELMILEGMLAFLMGKSKLSGTKELTAKIASFLMSQ